MASRWSGLTDRPDIAQRANIAQFRAPKETNSDPNSQTTARNPAPSQHNNSNSVNPSGSDSIEPNALNQHEKEDAPQQTTRPQSAPAQHSSEAMPEDKPASDTFKPNNFEKYSEYYGAEEPAPHKGDKMSTGHSGSKAESNTKTKSEKPSEPNTKHSTDPSSSSHQPNTAKEETNSTVKENSPHDTNEKTHDLSDITREKSADLTHDAGKSSHGNTWKASRFTEKPKKSNGKTDPHNKPEELDAKEAVDSSSKHDKSTSSTTRTESTDSPPNASDSPTASIPDSPDTAPDSSAVAHA